MTVLALVLVAGMPALAGKKKTKRSQQTEPPPPAAAPEPEPWQVPADARLDEVPAPLQADLTPIHRSQLMEWGLYGTRAQAIYDRLSEDPLLAQAFADLTEVRSRGIDFQALNQALERWNHAYAELGIPCTWS